MNTSLVYGWSKHQTLVSLSPGKAEYVAFAFCAKELSWLRWLYWELLSCFNWHDKAVFLSLSVSNLDSTVAIGIATNLQASGRMKHIDLKSSLYSRACNKRNYWFTVCLKKTSTSWYPHKSSVLLDAVRISIHVEHLELIPTPNNLLNLFFDIWCRCRWLWFWLFSLKNMHMITYFVAVGADNNRFQRRCGCRCLWIGGTHENECDIILSSAADAK